MKLLRRLTNSCLGLCCLVGFGMLVILGSDSAMAQSSASISGRVTDSSGAVIAGTGVTLTSLETGQARSVTTDESGFYRVLSLAVGKYEVKAEKPGFQTTVRTGVTLVVGQEAVLNLQMEVGAVQQEVSVTGEVALVNATLSPTSGLIAEQEVKDLPLNGRSFDQLLTLNVGTANFTSNRNTASVLGNAFSVSGRRPDENRFILNGIDFPGNTYDNATSLPTGASGQLLGVDAVREFNVVQNTYGAEYGKYAGGQISIITSSGTNHLHGDVFEFLRNSKLDARNFFDSASVPAFKRNQFGGSLGGPLRRDKLFLFGNFEGFRQRLGISSVAIVPNAQARQGNLPIGPTGSLIQVPNLKPGMLPFAQNFWPAPNGPDLGGGLAYSYANPAQKIQENFGLGRFDYNISPNDNFALSFMGDDGENNTPSADPIFITNLISFNYLTSVQETHIFSPSVLNTATLGFSRTYQVSGRFPVVPIPSNLSFLEGGIPGSITIGGGTNTAQASSVTSPDGVKPASTLKNIFTWADDMHVTRGSHSLALGVWIQRVQENATGASSSTAGTVSYPNLQAFLQDQPTTFTVAPYATLLGFRITQVAWYVQDEIKLRFNLTLRVGLRDEATNGFNEAKGRASIYVYDKNGVISENPRVSSSALTENNARSLWQPRVGLAWDPKGTGKWAVRAGYGIFNDLQDNLSWRVNSAYPYNARITISGPLLSIIPIPAGRPLPPPCNAALRAANQNCAIYQPGGVEPTMHTPTVGEWDFAVEHELAKDLMVHLSYAGSQSYHLVDYMNTNGIHPQVCSSPQGCLSGGTRGTPATAPTVPQGTTYVPLGTLPNPFVSYTTSFFYNNVSSYHALNFSLVKRLSNGLSFKMNYTFSKVLDLNSGGASKTAVTSPATNVNPYNLAQSKGLAVYDLRRQFNGNFSYALPFGHGRRYGSGLSGWKNKLIGGWQWNGIISAQDGFPVTPSDGTNISGTGDGGNPDLPNYNPEFSGPIVTGNPRQWFNPRAFLLPTAGTFGNVPRGALPGPGLFSMDTSFFKDVAVKEGMNLQFRAEFFNVLNRTNFGPPAIVTFSGGNYSPSAGAITATATTSRQVQFALKLIF